MTKERNEMNSKVETPALRGVRPSVLATLSANKITAGTLALLLLGLQASAASFTFSTGDPDGKVATLSRPSTPGKIQTETADDFVLTQSVVISQATFTGLLPVGAPLTSVGGVEVEIYHVFPGDSANPPSGNVPNRTNSPADVEIDSATRDSADGSLTFSATIVNPSFRVLNSVVNGINKSPGERTNGEGAVTGEEVLITVNFNPPIALPADHYFFRPEVLLNSGDFLWLSAPRPIVAPGTPFMPDLQSWIRNDAWPRIGCASGRTSPARDRLTRRFRSPVRPTKTLMESQTHWICVRALLLAPLWTQTGAASTRSRPAAVRLRAERGKTTANTFPQSRRRSKSSWRRI